MPITNAEIARTFDQLADLLEIEDANPFRVRAYRNAALAVNGLSRQCADMVAAGEDLSEIYGIGKDLAKKIHTLVETGELPALEQVKQRVPVELTELMAIGQLGPKRVKALYQDLGVRGLDDLEQALREHRVRELEGFGAKTEQRIQEGVERLRSNTGRTRLADAAQVVVPLVGYLERTEGVERVTVAGSYRRRKPTVGDLDILVICDDGPRVMERFVNYPEVESVASRGDTRSTVYLRSGLQVDLRAVPHDSYGAALQYFTGSKAHGVALRGMAQDRGLKINEYGVYRGEECVAGATEKGVYAALGLPWIEPELRENQGEIEAAQSGRLPELITRKDLRGDLHAHTDATDGRHSLSDMAKAARHLDYEYLAITDHSKRLTVARGLDEKRLARHIEAIDELNQRMKGFTLLKGIEVDILEDGRLDLPDEALAELDLVVAAAHFYRELDRKAQTRRLIRAMDNPLVNILAHPTGRLIGERDPYELDMDAVIQAAAERGVHLELNAQPARFDLPEQYCRRAKEAGVKIALSTDAHSTSNLELMPYGVDQARRGWLEADDVINTRGLAELRELLVRA